MENRQKAFQRGAELLDWYREQQRLRDIRVWREQEPTGVPEDYRWHYQRSTADNSAKRDGASSLELIEKGGYCIGDPDDCIRYLDQFEPTGLDEMMPLFQIGPIAHQEVMQTLSLFGKYVIPHFQDKVKTKKAAGAMDDN
jgi:hypothetical protein